MKISDEKIAEATRLRKAGLPFREIARRVGCSHTVIRKHLARTENEAPPPAPPAPELEPENIPPENLLAFLRENMQQSFRVAKESRAVGNFASAQRASRDVAMLAAVVARLEKAQGDDAEYERYSKADIDEAMRTARERFATLLDRPLLCSHCGRRLSAAYANTQPSADE